MRTQRSAGRNQRQYANLRVQVADRAGAYIPSNCCSGSCGTCEVEVAKTNAKSGAVTVGVARACVAAFPSGYSDFVVSELVDPVWGT